MFRKIKLKKYKCFLGWRHVPKSSNPFIKSAFNKIETGCQFFLHQTRTTARAWSHKQRRVKMCQNVEYLNVWNKTPTFCFSILLFSFTLVCPSSLFPLCVETIFIPRVPQSRHNWWRNAQSESINPFYPSVTPLHCPPQFIFPAQNRALLYSTLLINYNLYL